MTRRWVAVVALLAPALASVACDAARQPVLASVRLAITADTCARTCADAVQARIFSVGDPLPLGPARLVSCGEDIVFEALPAGYRVEIEVDVVTDDGEVLWRGRSDPTTVVADDEIAIAVLLVPQVTPSITAITPDPSLLSPAGAELTLSGAGFGLSPDGDAGVSLGDSALEVVAWSDDTIVVALPPTSAGATLLARRCGVSSSAAAIRLVDPAGPGHAPVPLAPGCDGRRFVAAAPEGGDALVVATRCAAPELGYLQRLRGGGACPLAPGEAWTLGGPPVALTVVDAVAWVALEGGAAVPRVDLPTNTRLTDGYLAEGATARALAGGGGRVFAVVITGDDDDTALVELTGDGASPTPVAGVDAGLALAALAVDGDRLFATAVAEGPVGKLIAVPLAGGPVVSWSLPGCDAPGALAVGADGWVGIACSDATSPHVIAFAPASVTLYEVPLAAGVSLSRLAFDGRGDVALALDPARGEASLLQLASGTLSHLVTWTAPGAPLSDLLIAFGDSRDRFLVGVDAGESLAVWTPYAAAGPCAEGAR